MPFHQSSLRLLGSRFGNSPLVSVVSASSVGTWMSAPGGANLGLSRPSKGFVMRSPISSAIVVFTKGTW
jgi:hypothetical protein